MNTEVIRAAVNVEPQAMDMNDFAYQEKSCGTVACIAGNCLIQHGWSVAAVQYGTSRRIEEASCELMGIDLSQAGRLLYVENWPKGFIGDGHIDGEHCEECVIGAGGDRLTPGTPEYLARVKERVELFIATGGAE